MAELPPLDILFEDNHCVAVVKPARMPTTHYDGTEETLDRQVKAYLKSKYAKPGDVFLGIVHRLDKPTSGVVLFARTSKGAARIAEQFREGGVDKVYWAIVEGQMKASDGTLEDWLWKDDTGFFGFFDTIDDKDVAQALLDAAEKWLREKGMKHVIGPLSLYANEEIGILVEGFDGAWADIKRHHVGRDGLTTTDDLRISVGVDFFGYHVIFR